jgi:hypothetical protein
MIVSRETTAGRLFKERIYSSSRSGCRPDTAEVRHYHVRACQFFSFSPAR